MIIVENQFARPYIKGDIKLKKNCDGSVGCLKMGSNQCASTFQGMFNYFENITKIHKFQLTQNSFVLSELLMNG